jgi:GntR family transcriptional regulator, transcriptional repressor for pyruvate dehydrogenase complex
MKNPLLLEPIQRANLTDEIVKRIVDMILDRHLQPGEKLPPERELAQQLSVGRSSLREAIKILSATGVVRVSIGEGMFVGHGDLSRITESMTLGFLLGDHGVNELLEARRTIELELAALAAERGTDAEIAEIGRHLETMRRMFEDPAGYGTADLEFHLAVARAAHNRVLFSVFHSLRKILRPVIVKHVAVHDVSDMPVAFRTHVLLYEALKRRDPAGSRQAMAVQFDRLEGQLRRAGLWRQPSEAKAAGASGGLTSGDRRRVRHGRAPEKRDRQKGES